MASAAADRAEALVQPGDPKYAQIAAAAVASAMAAKDTARAEKIVRQFSADRPHDPQAELSLGQFLRERPGKADEAMAVLSKPISAAGLEGFQALTAHSIEAERIYALSMMQAQNYAGTTDPAQRKLLLDQMQMGLKSLEQMSGNESMAQLRLKARIHEIKGEGLEAMDTYQRALNLMERNGVKDYDVMNDAAGLDMQLGQTGSAMKLLSQIVDYDGNYVPARFYLAQLYLQQDDPDAAQQQLDVIQKLAPQTPDLPKMRISQLTQQNKPDAAKAIYDKLPEATPLERLAKAQLALQLKNYLESIRLLEIARKETPGNVAVMVALAQSYAVRDQKEKARDVITEALKANPNERRLLILQKQLENATPAELEKLNEQLRAGADDYTREIQEYQLAASHGKPDEALKHLQAADKLKPDAKLVAELYFDFYINQGKFDLAKEEIPTLVRLKADEADGWISRAQLALCAASWMRRLRPARRSSADVRNSHSVTCFSDRPTSRLSSLKMQCGNFTMPWIGRAQTSTPCAASLRRTLLPSSLTKLAKSLPRAASCIPTARNSASSPSTTTWSIPIIPKRWLRNGAKSSAPGQIKSGTTWPWPRRMCVSLSSKPPPIPTPPGNTPPMPRTSWPRLTRSGQEKSVSSVFSPSYSNTSAKAPTVKNSCSTLPRSRNGRTNPMSIVFWRIIICIRPISRPPKNNCEPPTKNPASRWASS